MHRSLLSLIGTLISSALLAQILPADSLGRGDKPYPLVLSYSFLDLPFRSFGARSYADGISTDNAVKDGNFGLAMGYQSPEQAMQLNNGLTMAGHWGIAKLPVFSSKPKLNRLTRLLATGVFDYFMQLAPFGAGWMHEEGHRAIMANSYTSSYNPFSLVPAEDASGNGVHAVSQVLDTNLVMMKADNNANFIRMSTMGGEMSVLSVMDMQRTVFFHSPAKGEAKGYAPVHSFFYLFNLLNVQGYIKTCSNKEELTDRSLEQMAREGDRQDLRDFTGFDFAAWAYDLGRPGEAYSERGQNPYGNGYDRYIYGDKLTDEEYDWLKKQSGLAWINLISPANILIDAIPIGEQNSFNFSGRYYPTSFGNQIGLDLLYRTPRFNFFVSPHLNQNKDKTFLGVEAMLYEKPFTLGKARFLGTVRAIADLQPAEQRFTASSADFTGLLGGTVLWRVNDVFLPYFTLEGKGKGWVAGNAFLNEQISFRFGLSARLG